eukprot:2290955-Rhodomonas_salina.1
MDSNARNEWTEMRVNVGKSKTLTRGLGPADSKDVAFQAAGRCVRCTPRIQTHETVAALSGAKNCTEKTHTHTKREKKKRFLARGEGSARQGGVRAAAADG